MALRINSPRKEKLRKISKTIHSHMLEAIIYPKYFIIYFTKIDDERPTEFLLHLKRGHYKNTQIPIFIFWYPKCIILL